jgi:hypothetical protein
MIHGPLSFWKDANPGIFEVKDAMSLLGYMAMIQ